MKIMCGHCGKPVDRWETIDDVASMSIRVRAFCHGAADECSIPQSLLHDIGRLGVQEMLATGVAFTTKAITTTP